jgi:acetyl-CoA synthase
MSKIIATAAIKGGNDIVTQAETFFEKAREEKGEDTKIGFPDTAYYLPMAHALMGLEVETVGGLKQIIDHARDLIGDAPPDDLWFPYLGTALDAGVGTLLAEEIIMVLRYLYEQEPQEGCNGFFSDTILRTLGIQLVDGRMPGFAAILGAAPDSATGLGYLHRSLWPRYVKLDLSASLGDPWCVDLWWSEGWRLQKMSRILQRQGFRFRSGSWRS